MPSASPNPQGVPIAEDLFEPLWRAAAGPLGIRKGAGCTSCDAYASLLIRQGLNVKVVAERLGDGPQMVLNVYVHLCQATSTGPKRLSTASSERTTAHIYAHGTHGTTINM